MATDKKISELTSAGALTGAETLEVVQGGANKQTTTQAIADLVGGSSVRSWKDPAYVATTANITLSGDQTIDGISTAGGIRVLVKDQSDFTQNGIYLSSSGAWSRATDSDTAGELEGAAVTVQDGVVNGNTTWVQTADGITLGVTGIEWEQFATTPNAANISFTPAGSIAATDVQAAIVELDSEKQNLVNSATALVDAASMDLTAIKHTLTTSSATRTFTISYTGDDITLEVTLNTTSSTFTFPAAALCVSEGSASGNNTCALVGSSGDKYMIAIKKVGSAYYVVCKNFGQ